MDSKDAIKLIGKVLDTTKEVAVTTIGIAARTIKYLAEQVADALDRNK